MTFSQIVSGLEQAATSNETYRAAKKAKHLGRAERQTIEEFCYFVWQIKVNGEERKLAKDGYATERIMRYAAYEEEKPFTREVRAALSRLERRIDVNSLTPSRFPAYIRACYR